MSPRLNFEDGIWSDSRFLRLAVLLQDEARAIGVLVLAWKLAQKCWCPDRAAISEAEWANAKLPNALIECGLAERRGEGIYMKGSENAFAWWFQRIEAGRKGGLAKASKAKRNLAEAKQNVPSSSSSSSTTIQNTYAQTGARARRSRCAYDQAFEEAYGKYPRREGKSGGFKIYERLTPEEKLQVGIAVENYSHAKASEDPRYLKHFSTWMGEWRDWMDPKTGSSAVAGNPSINVTPLNLEDL